MCSSMHLPCFMNLFTHCQKTSTDIPNIQIDCVPNSIEKNEKIKRLNGSNLLGS